MIKEAMAATATPMAILTVMDGARPMDRAAHSPAGATAIAAGCMVTAPSVQEVGVQQAEAGLLTAAAVTAAEAGGALAPPV